MMDVFQTSTGCFVIRLLVSILVALLLAGGASAQPRAGDLPPDEVGRMLDSKPVLLSSYVGKAVVLTYWATWCPYCLKELPVLERIQEIAGTDRIQVIAVNTEERDVFRKARRALDGLTLLLAYDPGESSQKAFGVKSLPHMIIIGRDGRIVKIHQGYDEGNLEAIAADVNRAIAAPMPQASHAEASK